MKRHPMSKVSNYKGYILEYTGIPDSENPIGLYFDSQNDAPHILISGSIEPGLMDAVAEAIINKDNIALENILDGAKKTGPQLSAKVETELIEICFRKGVKWR